MSKTTGKTREHSARLPRQLTSLSTEFALDGKAPRDGLEPSTFRLTAGCSTIELPRNIHLCRLQALRPEGEISKSIQIPRPGPAIPSSCPPSTKPSPCRLFF